MSSTPSVSSIGSTAPASPASAEGLPWSTWASAYAAAKASKAGQYVHAISLSLSVSLAMLACVHMHMHRCSSSSCARVHLVRSRRIVVLAIGVRWLETTLQSTTNAYQFFSSRGVDTKVFAVNADECREQCADLNLLVGVPAVMVFSAGGTRLFIRGGAWEKSTILTGFIDSARLPELWSAIQESLANNEREVVVPF